MAGVGNVREVNYIATTESLYGIMAGLAVSPEDRILAVGGSGDVAFTLLSVAEHVGVIDQSPEQMNLIRDRYEALQNAQTELFLLEQYDIEASENDESDILHRSRILHPLADSLECRLERMKLLPSQDAFENLSVYEGYNKAYLSNALDWSVNKTRAVNVLSNIASRLSGNAMIYVANAEYISPKDPSEWTPVLAGSGLGVCLIPTALAREFEKERAEESGTNLRGWSPVVLQRSQL